MPDQIEIYPLTQKDAQEVVALWNKTLTAHPMTIDRFNSLFFGEINAEPKLKLTAFIAKHHELVGFVIGYQRNLPAPGLGLEPELGYLTAIGVDPKVQRNAIGSLLLEKLLNELGNIEILLCGRTGSAPAAVFPGVELENYLGAVEFFEQHGFAKLATANSMSREITDIVKLDLPAEVTFATNLDLPKFENFIATAFPGDWAEVAVKKAATNPAELGVVMVNNQYAGFAVWNQGWFGPVGVAAEFRKYGLGKLLVKNAMNQMSSAGIKKIWFNWADEWVVPFYKSLGFEINRSYQRMQRKN